MTRGGTAAPVSRDQILTRERRPGKYRFTCSADHKQDWQPYSIRLILTLLKVLTILGMVEARSVNVRTVVLSINRLMVLHGD